MNSVAVRQLGWRFRDWFAAIFLAVELNALWFVWLSPAEPEHKAPVSVPGSLVYLQMSTSDVDTAESTISYASSVWSPVLFALPTADGYSGLVLGSARTMRPPLRSPHEAVVLLDRPISPVNHETAVQLASLSAYIGKAHGDYDPMLERSNIHLKPADTSGLLLQFVGRFTSDDFEQTQLPETLLITDSPWEAVVSFAIDENGIPSRVLIENSEGNKNRTYQLVRAIRQWRVSSKKKGKGKLIIQCAGSGSLETTSEDAK